MTKSILEQIVLYKRDFIDALTDPGDISPCQRDFSHFTSKERIIIAEIKASSPSEGLICAGNFDPVSIAHEYISGGADAISILTDEKFFSGSFDILDKVRKSTSVPLLCKDFILCRKHIRIARKNGADLCLLIVKILDVETLRDLVEYTRSLGMKAVVEIQNAEEADIAISAGSEIILINNRNLHDFTIDMRTTHDLVGSIPDHILKISASGIRSPADIALFPARINGFLIGTALMRSGDRKRFIEECRAT